MAKPDFYLEMIDRLRGTTPGYRIFEHFCEAVDNGENPDERVMFFLSEAFKEILTGVPWKKAFNLEKGRGRKNNLKSNDHKLQNALKVAKLMRSGKTYEISLNIVAKESGRAYKTVQNHYGIWKDYANFILDQSEPVENAKKSVTNN